jgi:hypothetical protein
MAKKIIENEIKKEEKNLNFSWCGYTWKSTMDGNRLIHPSYPWYWYSSEENVLVRMRNGEIHFYCKYNPKDIKHYNGNIYHPTYEAATIRSVENFGYGEFSCEMVMPKGKNLSASFWLSGNGNWPPEIDIEEGWTEEKNTWFRIGENYFPWFKPSWRTTTNVHYRENDLTKTHVGSRNISYCKQPKDPAENWIEYKCVWKPNSITFYANGKEVRKITGKVCRKMVENLNNPEKGFNMNVIFNVWPGNPETHNIEITQPMKIRNFKYKPL